MPNLPLNNPSPAPSVSCRTFILFLRDGEGILDLCQVPGVPAPTRPAGKWGQQTDEVLVPKWDVEVVWLIATYQEMVQEVCLARGVRLLPEDLKARLTGRLRMSCTRALELLLVNL